MSQNTRLERYLRGSEPILNSTQDLVIFNVCVIEARGVDNNYTVVLQFWKSIAWVQEHRFEICGAGGQAVTDFHTVFFEEEIYELYPPK